MVQILQNRKPESFLESILTGYEKGREDYVKAYPTIAEEKRMKEQSKAEEDLAQRMGLNLRGVSPEMRRLYIAEKLKGEREMQEFKAKQDQENEREKRLQDRLFGKKSVPSGAPAYSSSNQQSSTYGNQNIAPSFGSQIAQENEQQPSFTNQLLQEPTTTENVPSQRTPPFQEETNQAPAATPQKRKWTDEEKQYLALSKDPNAQDLLKLIEHEEAQELAKTTAEKKEVTESYGENKDYINKIYDEYESSLRKEAILERMNQLGPDTDNSGIVNLLEQIGFQPEWLQNPANEEYNKLGLDLLGGGTLQADYGSRVLGSEFAVAQQRIPTLNQTKEGRQQIAENMKLTLLPAKLKRERMQYYLDKADRTGQPLPHNLRGKILNDIRPELEAAYDAFKQRNGRYKVREGTQVDDNAAEKYFYLSKGDFKVAEKMMRDDGYDIE